MAGNLNYRQVWQEVSPGNLMSFLPGLPVIQISLVGNQIEIPNRNTILNPQSQSKVLIMLEIKFCMVQGTNPDSAHPNPLTLTWLIITNSIITYGPILIMLAFYEFIPY